jgi:hypothetical protein
MAGYVARLTHGANYIPLDETGRIKLSSFIPPVTNETPQTAGGTSANRYGGGELVSVRAANREFTFSLIAQGASDAECERAIRDVELFLKQWAGNKDTPLYLEWRSDNNVGFEPLWGQFGASKRVQIEWGEIMRQPSYLVSNLRSRAQKADVRLQIRPYALGKRQRLAQAKGGIYEEVIGTTNGISRGMGVPEITTNKMTNPIFGSSTYDTGWTADASIVASQNTNAHFVLPGTMSSVKLTARATGQEYYQSINVGNTNAHVMSCYAKRPDGAAVSSSDLELFYALGVIAGATYTAVGNGWYRLVGSTTGIASSQNTGAQVKNGRTVYATGFQFEEKSYATPLCYGDMLGCSWSGTAHASTSVRSVAYARIPVAVTQDAFNLAEATYRVVWKPEHGSTAAGDRYLWSVDIVGEYVRYIAADDTFEFSDATNAATTAAQTFSAGDVLIFHFVRSPEGGLVIYKAGASAATNATYTPTSTPSAFYIGSDSTPANHANGTFLDFTVYDQAMTAAEVLADYSNIVRAVEDDERLSPIPYLWNKDGDSIVDNCDDSTRDNWVVAGGIPGNVPAETLIFGLTSSSFDTIGSVWLSNLTLRTFHIPSDICYFDLSGTVDANSSGGQYDPTSVSTSTATIGTGTVTPTEGAEELLGREFIIACRLGDAGSDLSIRSQFSTLQAVSSEYKAITTSATFFFFVTKPLVLPTRSNIFRSNEGEIPLLAPESILFNLQGQRSTGTANVNVDYAALLFRPYLKIGSIVSSDPGFVYWSKTNAAGGIVASTGWLYALSDFSLALAGDVFELVPERYNLITSFMGDAAAAATITRTMSYTMYVVPRWSLL